jgi:hypothetical protein
LPWFLRVGLCGFGSSADVGDDFEEAVNIGEF